MTYYTVVIAASPMLLTYVNVPEPDLTPLLARWNPTRAGVAYGRRQR